MSDDPPGDGSDDRRGAPPPWLWPVALLPLLASAASRGLWAPDEPRYAEIARQVFRSGDAIVLRLCGDLYPDKPPLLFWLAGLFGSWSGWHELAIRAPSLLAMAGTAWIVRRLALRWWGEREAAWAPLLFLATAMPTVLGGRLQIDPLLLLFTTAAVWLASGDGSGRTLPTGRLALAGLALGLGALTKGPVAWSNAGLVLLAWLVLGAWRGGRRARFTWPGAAALVILAILPVASWAWAAVTREPALRGPLLWGEHLARVATARNHPGPPWQPTQEILLYALPWTLPLIAVLVGVVRRWRKAPRDEGLERAAAWVLALLVFFSLIATKRELYLLPIFPAIALLVARWLSRRIEAGAAGRAWPWLTVPSAALLALIGVASALVFLAGDRIREELPMASGLAVRGLVAGVPTIALGVMAVAAALRRRPSRWAGFLVAAWIAAATLVAIAFFPPIDEVKCARGVARVLAARPEHPMTIPCVGTSPEAYRFYSGRPTVEDRVEEAWAREGDAFLALVSKRHRRNLPREIRKGTVVLHEARVGSRRVQLLGRVPDPGR